MRIGIDARMITHPGIGRYLRSLVPEMAKQAAGDEFVLFGEPEELGGLASAAKARVVPWDAPIYSPREQMELPYEKEKLDVLHVPHFNIPLFYKGKMVVTIHDLIYLVIKRSVPSPFAKWYARFMIGSALKKAQSVIAVSNNTKQDLVKHFGGARADTINVVYEAADSSFKAWEDPHILDLVRRKYHLNERIMLYVGSVKPHKNVETLIRVYAQLKKWGAPHQLVIAGRWDNKENYLKPLMAEKGVRYLGEVPAGDLAALYGLADVLIHLSLYEGFGLTVLEAMQSGTPVVMSDASSLPEVGGDAALTVSPLNVAQIADSVYNVLVNGQLREGMIREGLVRAKEFSWQRAARETLSIYRKTA